MRKIFLLATALLFTALGSANEYTNDKYCVYSLNVGEQTACVVNFCSEASSVIIPSSFVYKGDTYVVDGLVNNDFKGRYDSKYCYEDYAENRSCIVELNLPTTLKYIDTDAFRGMTRLKSITIPSCVKTVYDHGWGIDYFDFRDWFAGNSRLENITFQGMLWYSSVCGGNICSICIVETSNPSYVLDSLKNELSSSKCPKLQTIEVVPLKDYIFYKDKLDKSYASYSKRLSDSVSIYQTRLTRHPYYIEDNYFNKITIQKPVLTSTQAKENYTTQSAALKKEYNRQLASCRAEYRKLWNNMEQNCKQKSPETYAERYCVLHPEFSVQVDSMLENYKCRHTKQSLASLILQNVKLGKTCQESLWAEYAYLYKSKEDFLIAYMISPDINITIAERKSIYDNFLSTIKVRELQMKGIYHKDSWAAIDFKSKYDLMKKYEIPIDMRILRQDPKAVKEFEKNGQYFDSPDEFFAAYIRSNYSNILKSKKKSRK